MTLRRAFVLPLTIALLMVSVSPATAATTWKKVTPSKKFIAYAKHAKKHGIQAWYPSRMPSGFKMDPDSFIVYNDPKGRPQCGLTFVKGDHHLDLYNGTRRGGNVTRWTGSLRWGTKYKAKYLGKSVHTIGRSGKRLSSEWSVYTVMSSKYDEGDKPSMTASQMRTIAKSMRKVP